MSASADKARALRLERLKAMVEARLANVTKRKHECALT
jgi:hypothetical protein